MAIKLGAVVDMFVPDVPMPPVPAVIFNVPVVAILAPLVCVMLPALPVSNVNPPLAVVVYAPPNDMFPPLLPAALDNVTASPAPNVTADVLATVMLPAVPPPTPVFTVSILGSLAKYNVPLPFATCRSLFIVTLVESKFSTSPLLPLAVTVFDEDVEVIVPVPVAVIVTFVPFNTPASDMLELVPLSINDIVPVECNPPLPTVIVPELALSVKYTNDGLFVVFIIVVLAESVMYTEPAVSKEIVGALVSILAPDVPTVPVPVPVTSDRVPEVEILVAAA